MSIQAIYDLNTELKRLSIASVNLAKGDFRLNKLIPIFKKSGESVPIFNKVALLTEKLISEEEQNRSSVLLELLNIVIAIISTQGETSISGDFTELDLVNHNVETKIPYRKLKPVMDALENTGAGRIKIIEEGDKNNVYNDIRTVKPLIKALGATYPEINEFAYKKLREFKTTIVELLKKSIDIKDVVVTSRIISLVSEIAKAKENEFYLSFLNNESTDEILVASIKALKDKVDNLNVVLEYIHHKKKAVRTAAYTTLASFNNTETINVFIDAYNNNERELIKEGINYFDSIKLLNLIISKTLETLSLLTKSDKFLEIKSKNQKLKYQDKDASLIVDSLEIITNKKDKIVFDFYKEIYKYINDLSFIECPKNNSYNNASELLIYNLFTYNTKPALKMITDLQKIADDYLKYSFVASTIIKRPVKVYNEYSKFIIKNKNDPKAIIIIDLFYDLYNSVNGGKSNYLLKILFEQKYFYRWSNIFIDLDIYNIVLLFAKLNKKKVSQYLMKKATELFQTKNHPWDIVKVLLSMNINSVAGFVIQTLKDLLKNDINVVLDYGVLYDLPKSCADEVEKIGNEFNNPALTRLANTLRFKQ